MTAKATLLFRAAPALACVAVAVGVGCERAEAPAVPAPGAVPAAGARPTGSAAAATAVQVGQPVTLQGTGESGQFAFELRFGAPRVGELFVVEGAATEVATGKPVTAGTWKLDATMPAHGHGMITDPQHRLTAPGAWRSEGMKLHMHGRWVFEVELDAAGRRDKARIAYDQPPVASQGL